MTTIWRQDTWRLYIASSCKHLVPSLMTPLTALWINKEWVTYHNFAMPTYYPSQFCPLIL